MWQGRLSRCCRAYQMGLSRHAHSTRAPQVRAHKEGTPKTQRRDPQEVHVRVASACIAVWWSLDSVLTGQRCRQASWMSACLQPCQFSRPTTTSSSPSQANLPEANHAKCCGLTKPIPTSKARYHALIQASRQSIYHANNAAPVEDWYSRLTMYLAGHETQASIMHIITASAAMPRQQASCHKQSTESQPSR